jgi:phosphoribosylformylglycinamidine synthase
MTLDCNSRYCAIDPRQGTALSLAEACRNIAAVGAFPIGISDCLNFGSPERAEGMWQIAESIRGLGESARAFNVPVVSGNVSLYNETKGKGILPTPLLAVVGLISDASRCVGAQFVQEGDTILVLGATQGEELGGSDYMAVIAGVERGALPTLNYDLEIATANLVRDLIGAKLLKSCHDLSGGGLAVALAEACFGAERCFGARLSVDEYSGNSTGLLFAETGARYLISCDPKLEKKIRTRALEAGIPVTLAGKVGGDSIGIEGVASISAQSAWHGWKHGLDFAFGKIH